MGAYANTSSASPANDILSRAINFPANVTYASSDSHDVHTRDPQLLLHVVWHRLATMLAVALHDTNVISHVDNCSFWHFCSTEVEW